MDRNVYYHPEKSGLSQVGLLDQGGLSYEYNTLVVWQDDKTGRVFYAEDSGCSCPTPFEAYHFNSADDTNLTEIASGPAFDEFKRAVEAFPVDLQEQSDLIIEIRLLI